MRPDASSFRIHSRTSKSSPSLSFRVVVFSFRVSSFAPSPAIANDGVKIVSFTTFTMRPPSLSSKKSVPWFPMGVTHPSALSLSIRTRARMSSTLPSLTGPSRSSHTSSTSRRREGLLPLILLSFVRTVSFTTFMKQRMRPKIRSFESAPSSSSSRYVKSLVTSSSVSSAASSVASPFLAGFSHLWKKPWKSDSSARPSLFLSTAAKSSSGLSSFTVWWKRISFIARARKTSTS
mmetsp:Transcript_49141/g.137593  ORF Transcript_49141/g.137593 Transcript_49141/m.137593 type:complete len:234 (+) Transcript_49141:199-900(+)